VFSCLLEERIYDFRIFVEIRFLGLRRCNSCLECFTSYIKCSGSMQCKRKIKVVPCMSRRQMYSLSPLILKRGIRSGVFSVTLRTLYPFPLPIKEITFNTVIISGKPCLDI
jgi:hypothetical protein